MNISIADITLPVWLVASQWTLLFALGILVILAYRQISFMLKLKNLGTDKDGLPIEEKAPSFDYIAVKQATTTLSRFEPEGRWSLLLFADPGCASCQSTLLALERLVPKLSSGIRILVITSVDPAQITGFSEFKRTFLDIGNVSKAVIEKLYRIHTTPFAYLIDSTGVIQAKGLATDETAIRKIARKADRRVVEVVV